MDDPFGKPSGGCNSELVSCAGNNAVEMQTTATFDEANDEFVIRTPTTLAQKYWITNSAVHAKWAVVFAQLIIGQQNHGIHGFLVRIRNEVRLPSPTLFPLPNRIASKLSAGGHPVSQPAGNPHLLSSSSNQG